MVLQMGRRMFNVLLKMLSGIVIVPILLGIVLFVVCGSAPPFVFLISFIVFMLWGSHWTFVAWFLVGAVICCGLAHYVVFQMARKQQSKLTMMSFFLYGIGWLLSLVGVILFLTFGEVNIAIVCEICGLVCWYLVERVEKKQKKQNARLQFLAILHHRTQIELQRIENADAL